VFQNGVKVLCFHPAGMHTPNQKVQEDIEFPKVLTAKPMPGKVKQLRHLEMIATTSS
jgi:hypothetical protein